MRYIYNHLPIILVASSELMTLFVEKEEVMKKISTAKLAEV